MPEIIIKYKNSKTLEALTALSKYLDFIISPTRVKPGKKEKNEVNGIPFIKGDASIDISALNKAFTGKGIDAKELRKKAWQRSN